MRQTACHQIIASLRRQYHLCAAFKHRPPRLGTCTHASARTHTFTYTGHNLQHEKAGRTKREQFWLWPPSTRPHVSWRGGRLTKRRSELPVLACSTHCRPIARWSQCRSNGTADGNGAVRVLSESAELHGVLTAWTLYTFELRKTRSSSSFGPRRSSACARHSGEALARWLVRRPDRRGCLAAHPMLSALPA